MHNTELLLQLVLSEGPAQALWPRNAQIILSLWMHCHFLTNLFHLCTAGQLSQGTPTEIVDMFPMAKRGIHHTSIAALRNPSTSATSTVNKSIADAQTRQQLLIEPKDYMWVALHVQYDQPIILGIIYFTSSDPHLSSFQNLPTYLRNTSNGWLISILPTDCTNPLPTKEVNPK